MSFQYTAGGQIKTATIKAVNVTPGNNSNTLDLTSSAVGPYNFSYIAGQQHGQRVILSPGSSDTNVLGFTATSDLTPQNSTRSQTSMHPPTRSTCRKFQA